MNGGGHTCAQDHTHESSGRRKQRLGKITKRMDSNTEVKIGGGMVRVGGVRGRSFEGEIVRFETSIGGTS